MRQLYILISLISCLFSSNALFSQNNLFLGVIYDMRRYHLPNNYETNVNRSGNFAYNEIDIYFEYKKFLTVYSGLDINLLGREPVCRYRDHRGREFGISAKKYSIPFFLLGTKSIKEKLIFRAGIGINMLIMKPQSYTLTHQIEIEPISRFYYNLGATVSVSYRIKNGGEILLKYNYVKSLKNIYTIKITEQIAFYQANPVSYQDHVTTYEFSGSYRSIQIGYLFNISNLYHRKKEKKNKSTEEIIERSN